VEHSGAELEFNEGGTSLDILYNDLSTKKNSMDIAGPAMRLTSKIKGGPG
jgi:hypothetical protein